MWFTLFWVGLQSVAPAHAGGCPPDVAALLAEASQEVLTAYDNADEGALTEAEERVERGLQCLHEPLAPARLAEVHRAKALVAFQKGRSAEVRRAWAAVVALDSSIRPDAQRWHPTHPMWQHWEDATATGSDREQLRRVPPGGWLVDGVLSDTAPLDRAFLVQSVGETDGNRTEILDTAYAYSLGDIPNYPYLKAHPEVRLQRRKRMGRIGTVVSVTLLAGAAGAIGLAARDRHLLLTDPQYGDIDQRSVRANTEANVAVGLAAGSVATFVAAWTINW